jgi:hypothetical protein
VITCLGGQVYLAYEDSKRAAKPGVERRCCAARTLCGRLDGRLVGLGIYSFATILVTIWYPDTLRSFEIFSLFSDVPTYVGATLLAAVAARRSLDPQARRVWQLLTASLIVYNAGNLQNSISWCFGHDPFPSIGDVFFVAFYPLLLMAVLAIVRAGAVRVPWGRLALDGMILALGFGAFFWFFVIRPSSLASSDPDIIRHVLAQGYIVLSCLMVLTFGVFLMNVGTGPLARRTLMLMTIGFCFMFFADIVWAILKVTGQYMVGSLSDALYVSCYMGLAAAAREHLRGHRLRQVVNAGATLARASIPRHARGVRRARLLPEREEAGRLRRDRHHLRAHVTRDAASGRHPPR